MEGGSEGKGKKRLVECVGGAVQLKADAEMA